MQRAARRGPHHLVLDPQHHVHRAERHVQHAGHDLRDALDDAPAPAGRLVLRRVRRTRRLRLEVRLPLSGPFPSLSAAIAALTDEDPVRRTAAARRIGLEGPDAVAAAASLLARLEDADPMVRAMAAAALGKIGAGDRDVVEALVACFEDAAFPVRFWAAESLGRLARHAAGALPALERLRQDEHKAVRGAASLATQRIRAASEETTS